MNKTGWLLIIAGLSGCAVGPDYRSPVPETPDYWQAEQGEINKWDNPVIWIPADPQALKNWWKIFGDHQLDSLMERALSDNLDLKIVLARIDQARAERRAVRAALFPSVDIDAGAQRSHNPFPGFAPLQQVKMMTESGDQKHGWQEDSNADEISSKEDLSDKNEMVNLNARSSRKSESAEKPHETAILSKENMVAGVGFEPTTFGL